MHDVRGGSIILVMRMQGKAMPGAFGRERAGQHTAPGRDGSRKLQRFAGGEKVCYFRDDNDVDLGALVKRSRYGDDMHDLDAAFAANVVRNARYKGKEMDVDDEYDVDGGIQMFEDRCAPSACPSASVSLSSFAFFFVLFCSWTTAAGTEIAGFRVADQPACANAHVCGAAVQHYHAAVGTVTM
jgi:hypothetical protein